jgi:hypothetical protein
LQESLQNLVIEIVAVTPVHLGIQEDVPRFQASIRVFGRGGHYGVIGFCTRYSG